MNEGHEGRKTVIRLLRFAVGGDLTVDAIGTASADEVELVGSDSTRRRFPLAALQKAVGDGLLRREQGKLRATAEAGLFLRRALADPDGDAFLAQHRDEETTTAVVDGIRTSVRVNRAESPLGALVRLKDRRGDPFLSDEAVEAGERLLADFTRAQLQPRVTASWEPRLSARGKGERGGMADLADTAIAARQRVTRAVEAMGPELSGVALDVCCFMKGLELVERERQWPARSAKLLLRAALLALARHYRPPARKQAISHWGADGFRPEL